MECWHNRLERKDILVRDQIIIASKRKCELLISIRDSDIIRVGDRARVRMYAGTVPAHVSSRAA